MLQYEAVSPGTIVLLKKLCALPELTAFNLVGGTSLALQAGHRISVDLDFFTNKPFDTDTLRKNLSYYFPGFELISTSRLGFTCKIQNVKCDFFNWVVPFIKDPLTEDGIRLCAPEDIVAFKLDAILTRKEKKDFYDIEKLIALLGFENVLQFYRQKYPYNDYKLVLDALAEIDLADNSSEPVLLTAKKWTDVKQTIKTAWQVYRDKSLNRKEIEKQERLRKAEELLKNKKTDS